MAINLIYTNHVIKKMSDYDLEKWQVEKALSKPDLVQPSTAPGCKNYIRTKNNLEVGVTAKRKEDGVWLIVSAWKRKLNVI